MRQNTQGTILQNLLTIEAQFCRIQWHLLLVVALICGIFFLFLGSVLLHCVWFLTWRGRSRCSWTFHWIVWQPEKIKVEIAITKLGKVCLFYWIRCNYWVFWRPSLPHIRSSLTEGKCVYTIASCWLNIVRPWVVAVNVLDRMHVNVAGNQKIWRCEYSPCKAGVAKKKTSNKEDSQNLNQIYQVHLLK